MTAPQRTPDGLRASIEAGTLDPGLDWQLVKWAAEQYVRRQHSIRARRLARDAEHGERRHRAPLASVAAVERIAATVAERRATDWSRLFGQAFSLRDGTVVTWESATRQQHEERAMMLETMAAGTIETAVLHREAARALSLAGAARLGVLARTAVA